MKGIYYQEEYPGIFRITRLASPGNIRPQVNLYLIAGQDGLIFDAGHGDRKSVRLTAAAIQNICDQWQRDHGPCKVRRLLISHGHGDHFSGATGLRRKLGLKLILTEAIAEIVKNKKSFKTHFRGHRSEKMYYSTSFLYRLLVTVQYAINRVIFGLFFRIKFIPDPDIIINEKSTLSINGEPWDIFPSPGHCGAHITLYNKEKGILFSGDNVLRKIAPWLGPPKSCLIDYVHSLEEMQQLPKLELILPGHGSAITDPRARLDELLEWRRLRTKEIYESIKDTGEKGIHFWALMKILYPTSPTRKRLMATGWVQLSLDFLENKGFAKREYKKSTILYIATENQSDSASFF